MRFPRLTLSLALFFVVLGLVGASQYRFLLSVDDLVDPDFRSYSSLMRYKERFPDYNSVVISIEPTELPTKAFLCDVQVWAIRLNDKRDDILRISSTFGLRQAEIKENKLKFKPLLDLDCTSDDPQIDVIKKAYNEIRNSPWRTLLTDKDYALTLSLSFEGHGEDNRFGEFNADTAEEIRIDFDKALKAYEGKFKVYWAGVGSYQYELRKSFYISQALNVIMFGFVLLFFKFIFKSWALGWWFILTVDGTLFITYGIMGFLNWPVDVLTNSTGMMLIVSTLEDFILISFGTLFQKMTWRKSMRFYLVGAFWTSITTAVGFASLVSSDLSIIRRFGFLSAVAGILEWLFVFTVLPAALVLTKSKGWPKPQNLAEQFKFPFGHLQKLANINFPKWAAYLSLVVFPLGIWGSFNLTIEDAPEKFFPKGHIISETSDHLSKTRGWRSDVTLLFKDELPEDKKEQILKEARLWPNIAEVEDLKTTETYLVSKVETEDHKQAVLRFWRESPFLLRLKNEETERAILYLQNLDRASLEKTVKASEKTCPQKECEVASGLTSYVEFGERVLSTLFESLFLSLFLVVTILIYLARSQKVNSIWQICISSLWGPFALVAVFYVFNIPVFFVTTICAAVLVGLSGDNCIQFLFQNRRNNLQTTVNNLGLATVFITIAMVFVTFIFFFSPMWPLQKLGGLMIIGFWLGWVGDVLVLRGLLKK
ncbi:MAG: MMPL family transporter [Bdellovibrionales bacterium]